MNRVYTAVARGHQWLQAHRGCRPHLACILGFTETGLVPGISAAGATPDDRQTTAIADAAFLVEGVQSEPRYPLPPLVDGVSPVLVTRAIVAAQQIPTQVFAAGLPQPPPVPHVDCGGVPAACVTTGQAMALAVAKALFERGLHWGDRLAQGPDADYLILGECVVGGTTTALALLLGLGWPVSGKVSSSHPTCNHAQKQAIATTGLARAKARLGSYPSPLEVVAAIGDPMQIVVAGMAIAASRHGGVLLAGGTQMLAVYALARALTQYYQLSWQPHQIVVGTTRWVAEDATCDVVGIANLVGPVPLVASQLSFAQSQYAALRRYEAGFVKEGVAAGGCAIAGHLYQNWQQPQFLHAIESLYRAMQRSPAQCIPSNYDQ